MLCRRYKQTFASVELLSKCIWQCTAIPSPASILKQVSVVQASKISNSVWFCKTAHIKKHMNSIKSTAVATIIVTGIGMQSTGTPDRGQAATL